MHAVTGAIASRMSVSCNQVARQIGSSQPSTAANAVGTKKCRFCMRSVYPGGIDLDSWEPHKEFREASSECPAAVSNSTAGRRTCRPEIVGKHRGVEDPLDDSLTLRS